MTFNKIADKLNKRTKNNPYYEDLVKEAYHRTKRKINSMVQSGKQSSLPTTHDELASFIRGNI